MKMLIALMIIGILMPHLSSVMSSSPAHLSVMSSVIHVVCPSSILLIDPPAPSHLQGRGRARGRGAGTEPEDVQDLPSRGKGHGTSSALGANAQNIRDLGLAVHYHFYY
jgi:hypothetical protein